MGVSFNSLGSADGVLNGTTPVDVVASPGSSVDRAVRLVNCYNADTASVTVTLQLVNGADTRKIETAILAAGQTYRFGENMEVFILDATNKKLQLVMSGAAATNNPDWTTSWADYA